MEGPRPDPEALLWRGLASGRIHSAYLLSGPGEAPRRAAEGFLRGLVCAAPEHGRACETCRACRLSGAPSQVRLDGTGRKGPRLRHVGDHPDLIWVERGADDTRVRIGQIRELQAALRLRVHEGGRRGAVIADAEWLNQEAQNALLRLLEEPPPATTLVLVTTSPAGLLATVRSRCQRVLLPPPPARGEAPEAERELYERLDGLARLALPDVLDWAEECRGERATAAARAGTLLEVASRWLRDRVVERTTHGPHDLRRELAAFQTLQHCRKALVQRNANPQMVAERALLTLHEATAS